MAFPTVPNFRRALRFFVHGLGLSSLGSALFLQTLVFLSIRQNGYFRGVEQNGLLLNAEIALTAFAIVYFVYLFVRFIFKRN